MIISKEQYDKLPEKYKIYFEKFRNTHPTVKSIKLCEYLVKLITPPNGTVLDCFMGSGTTGIACANLNVNFIGIEKEKEYFEIAKARIEEAEKANMFQYRGGK
jgi:DNA modification methylase